MRARSAIQERHSTNLSCHLCRRRVSSTHDKCPWVGVSTIVQPERSTSRSGLTTREYENGKRFLTIASRALPEKRFGGSTEIYVDELFAKRVLQLGRCSQKDEVSLLLLCTAKIKKIGARNSDEDEKQRCMAEQRNQARDKNVCKTITDLLEKNGDVFKI